MLSNTTPARLLFLWTVVLLGPVAWSTSLATMFWLTDPTCQDGMRTRIFIVGAVCAALAVAGGLLAWRESRRSGAHSRPEHSADVNRFMLDLSMGCSALFALVILVSLVPALLLSPCRL